jgi:HTH-type transcriptional regulator / antitoxin HigA
MRKVLANPAEMIAHGAPRLIRNDLELAAYTEALFELTALEKPSRSEAEAIACAEIEYAVQASI